MEKYKIFIPILIVIVIIILIVSFSLLFGRGGGEGGEKTAEGVVPSVTRTAITPAIEADYDESLMEELNQAPKIEYRYTLSSGEEITINIPQGVDPPSLEVVEKLYEKRRE